MEYSYKQTGKTRDKIEFEVTVDYKELEQYKEETFKKLAPTIKVSGFRPGKAPRNVIEAKLGSQLITDSIGKLIPAVAFEIMQKEKARPVTSPEYDLKSFNEKDGIVFNFSYVNYPEVKLGDLSKIKIEKEEAKVEQNDVDMVIKSIVRSGLKPEQIRELTTVIEEKPKNKKIEKTKDTTEATDTKTDDKEHVHDEHDGHNHSHDHSHDDEKAGVVDFELNDKLVEALGYPEEKTLKDVRESVKKRLVEMKEDQVQNEYNSKLIQEAIKISEFEIPEVFLQSEVDILERQFEARLKDIKLDRDTYLKTQGSDIEKKRKEWEEQATNKISIDLILISIADKYGIVATEEQIDEEINKITDPNVKAQYKSESAREYVRSVITRQRGMEKLIEMVEGKKTKT